MKISGKFPKHRQYYKNIDNTVKIFRNIDITVKNKQAKNDSRTSGESFRKVSTSENFRKFSITNHLTDILGFHTFFWQRVSVYSIHTSMTGMIRFIVSMAVDCVMTKS
jgi:hypothetical protein